MSARTHYAAAMVFVLGWCLALLCAWWLNKGITADAQAKFEHTAERTSTEIRQRFDRPIYGLDGARGLYAASNRVTRAEFRAYVASHDVDNMFQGVRGFGFIQQVQKSEAGRFVTQEQADGAPEFAIRQLVDKSHDDLYVIKFIEPARNNGGAQGLDIGSESMRRAAAQQAVDTGLPCITGAITLVQDNKNSPGVLLFLPAYTQGAPLSTVAQRRAALVGLLYSPIVMSELLSDLPDVRSGLVDFEILDSPLNAPAGTLMFDADGHISKLSHGADPANGRAFSYQQSLHLPGRAMTLSMNSTPQFDATINRSPAWLALAGIGIVGTLLALLLQQQVNGRRRAEALARDMTADLDRLAQVAKHTSNAVSIADKDGRITWINDGFTRMTGFHADEVLGHRHNELLSSRHADAQTMRSLTAASQSGIAFRGEVLRRTKDGTELWIDIEIQPQFDANGQPNGFMAIGNDITARRKAVSGMEAALRENETLLRTLNLHTIVSVANREGIITEVNDAFCTISGYRREDLIGANHRIINSGRHCAAFWVDMWKTISSGMPWRQQVCNRARDGALYWVDTLIAPYIGIDGQIEKYVSIRNDITANKKAEEALRWNESLMQMMSNSSPLAFLVVDNRTDDILYFNRRFCEIWGIEHLAERMARGELKNKDIIPHCVAVLADVPAFAASCEPLQSEDNRITVEDEIAFHQGRTVRRFSTQIRDADDNYRGRFYIFEDVTNQRQHEEDAQRSAALLRGAIEAIDEAFVLYDPDDRLVLCNDKYRETYKEVAHLMVPGARFEDIIRAGAQMGQYAGAIGRVDAWVAERLTAHLAGNSTLIQKHTNGRTLRIIERKLPDGHIVGFRIDITDMVNATEAAQAASQSKSQFLANMSHEIRTPMNAILGMLTLLRKTALTPRQADYAAKSDGAARALLGLLNEILDFSKIEAGKMTLDPHPFDLDQLLSDLSVILSSSVGEKPVEVLFDIDPALPRYLVGDAMRLQQVLINLGGNAIKFTPQGDVVLAMQVLEQNTNFVTLQVSMRDSGIGIAPENQARIFSGFTQAESSTTRRFGGTGLGVVISQRFVALMGGELELQSTLGEGSRFFFTITLPVADTPADEPAQQPCVGTGSPAHVLVVDDNPTARAVTERMCQSLGWLVDSAASGPQALALLQARAAAKVRYQAVFVDWVMPEMDGWQTSQHIREQGLVGDAPLIVMVTAHGREALTQRSPADQSLLDGYLVKPVTAAMLFQAASVTRGDSSQTERATVPSGGQRLHNMRLLVVEDNPNNQQVARELLEDEGAIVQLANHGQEGVEAIAAADPPFDVVLMDLQMPVMDGFAATKIIRQDLALHSLPIVAMTANAMASDRDACLSVGMNDHVGKPFDLNNLVQVLRKQAGWQDVGALAQEALQTLPTPVIAAATHAGVDIQAALRRLGGKQEVYRRMLQTFLGDLHAMPGQLQNHAAQGDTQASTRLLHTLKGLAATLGASALSATAAINEKQMALAPPPSGVHDITQDACSAIASALPALTGLAEALNAAPVQRTGTIDTGAQAAEQQALLDALQQLALELAADDMQAMQTMAELQQRFSDLVGPSFAPLEASMAEMDFAGALPLCKALISGLQAGGRTAEPAVQ